MNSNYPKQKVNYMQVGRTIECSECFPSKDYYSCQKVEQEHGIKCKCICHEPEQKLVTIEPEKETKPEDSWEEEFNLKYCRKNRSPEKLGEPMDRWFFPEELTPFEVKSFIRKLLAQVKEEAYAYGRTTAFKQSEKVKGLH